MAKGVFERNGVWYAVVWHAGRKIRKRAGNKQAALDLHTKLKAELLHGRVPQTGRPMKFEEFVAEYLEIVRAKQASIRDTERYAAAWSKRFAGRTLKSILPMEIEKWATRRIAEVSPATVNRELSFLRALFNKARRNKLVPDNPVSPDHFYDEPDGRVRFLSDDEETRLREHLDPVDWRIVELAMHVGLREGNLIRLRWDVNVNLEQGVLVIPKTKNGRALRVPLNDTALAILRSLPSRFRGRWVFPNDSDTGPVDVHNWLERVWRPALEAAGIEDFRFHDLRHTFASRLAMQGISTREIAELLGHRSEAMTRRYAHLSPTHLREAVRALDRGPAVGPVRQPKRG